MKWKIACFQIDIALGQPDTIFRLQNIGWKAARPEPDIIILPELWTTGYDLTRLNEIADQEAEKTIEFLKTQAQKHQIHIIGGSIAKKTSKGIHKTMIIIDKCGKLIKEYDKLHLFQLMDEHHFLQPGEKMVYLLLMKKYVPGSFVMPFVSLNGSEPIPFKARKFYSLRLNGQSRDSIT